MYGHNLYTHTLSKSLSVNSSGWVQPLEHISPSFIWIFSEALQLYMQAVRLVSPPINPSILMLVHIRPGRSKPMINDVSIGLFSTTQPRCWVVRTLAYLSHPACQRKMFPARKIKAYKCASAPPLLSSKWAIGSNTWCSCYFVKVTILTFEEK